MSIFRLSIFLALFVFSMAPATAQEPDVWQVEIQQDWRIDAIPLDAEQDSGITTLKLLIEPPGLSFSQSPFLAELVCNAAALGTLKIYKDPACHIPTDWMYVLGYPEVAVDPDTGEETMKIGCLDFEPMAIEGWRVLQTITYRWRDDRWQVKPRAVAPLAIEKNNDGDSIGKRALFWFEPADACPEPDSRHIAWAKQLVNVQQKTLLPTYYDSNEHETRGKRRGPKGEIIGEHFWEYWRGLLEKRLQTPLYNASNEVFIPEITRPSMLYDYDTILNCFSDDTTMFSILRSDLMDDVKHLALLQTWCWEPRRSRLSICTEAIGPLRDLHDNEGNLRSRKPLFFRRIRR